MVGQPVQWLVDIDHLEGVQINGEPAGLTGGSWDADSSKWTGTDATLTWKKGDVMYQLSSPGAPVEDLIHMADSIPLPVHIPPINQNKNTPARVRGAP